MILVTYQKEKVGQELKFCPPTPPAGCSDYCYHKFLIENFRFTR